MDVAMDNNRIWDRQAEKMLGRYADIYRATVGRIGARDDGRWRVAIFRGPGEPMLSIDVKGERPEDRWAELIRCAEDDDGTWRLVFVRRGKDEAYSTKLENDAHKLLQMLNDPEQKWNKRK